MLSRGCVLVSLQCNESRCVLYLKSKKTQLRRQGTVNMPHGRSLHCVESCNNGFSVIKPHFSRRLSRFIFSAGSGLSRLFLRRLAGLAQIAAGGRCGMKMCPAWSAVRKTSNINIDGSDNALDWECDLILLK